MHGTNKLKQPGLNVGIQVMTRQRERNRYRAEKFAEICKNFPGESRQRRRAMAIEGGNRRYRQENELPEPRRFQKEG